MAFCKGRGTAGRCIGIGPYERACRGGRPCPPGPDNATPCRAGPVCPAVGAGKIRFGPMPTSAPTKALQEAHWAGDRKGRPYESATRGAMSGRPQGSPLRRGYKECDAVRSPPFLRPFKIIFLRCSYPCNECVFPVIDRIICLERRTIP